MKLSFFLFLVGCFFSIIVQIDMNKLVDDGKIVLYQIFNLGMVKVEIFLLKKEVEMLRKDVIQLLDKNKIKGKGENCQLIYMIYFVVFIVIVIYLIV